MGAAFGQGARWGIAALLAVVVAVAAWLYAQTPPEQPAPPPVPAAAPEAAPAPAPTPEPKASPMARFAPTLDVVRADPNGSVTVAGQAEALARVSLRVDGAEVAFAPADGAGAYASLFTLPPADAPRVLTVVATGTDGVEVAGTDRVILAPMPAAPEVAAPAEPAPEVLKETAEGVAVVTAADIANITIDSVAYEGDLIRIGGRGAGGAVVRLYLDNVDTASAPIKANGTFSADLAGVAPGTYTLRADQLDSAGKVTSRYELTITKAAPEALAAAAPAPSVVEVAAGTTLWAIAKEQFGDGLLYVQVYEANKDKIRNPDLIYPGQVFEIPKLP